MAVAAPKRRTAPAPPPSRTTPPKRKAAAAPAPAPTRKRAPSRAPAKKRAPAKRAPARRAKAVAAPAPARVPSRRAPQRTKPKVRRNPGARVIPFAGRTAVAVTQLPNSGLIVRLTRGRAWIGVLGVMLVGIVALNVVNLSFSAAAAKIDAQIMAVESENQVLKGRDATKTSTKRVRSAARERGFTPAASLDTVFTDYGPDTIATAVTRLAAASP
jgi:hypothetical protein